MSAMCAKSARQCCGEDKMCALCCCSCNLDVKKLMPLLNKPKFICKCCGRVANEKVNLCQPVLLR